MEEQGLLLAEADEDGVDELKHLREDKELHPETSGAASVIGVRREAYHALQWTVPTKRVNHISETSVPSAASSNHTRAKLIEGM